VPISSLIGKQSGKDRIDRMEMYKKHDIALKGQPEDAAGQAKPG